MAASNETRMHDLGHIMNGTASMQVGSFAYRNLATFLQHIVERHIDMERQRSVSASTE